MAFKSKIKPEDLKELTEVNYIKLTQKEVKRAAKFGETGVVILSDYEFACGSVGTMLLLGKMSGPLMKYYKQIKKERAKEKDFAKGTCYFEDGDNPMMRIAFDDGKGKSNKMKKNGKKLLKKLDFSVNFFKGDLGLEDETLEEEELEQIEEQVDAENEDQKMKKVLKAYKKSICDGGCQCHSCSQSQGRYYRATLSTRPQLIETLQIRKGQIGGNQ